MPMCDIKEEVGDEGHDTVSFSIQLSNPKPDGLKLAKRSRCIINIEANDEAEN